MQLTDSLNNYLKEFNADGRYHIILSNSAKDNVLWAAEQYDITNEVIEGMNARYAKWVERLELRDLSLEISG